MAKNYKKIFFSSTEIVNFGAKLKTMVDSILTFIKYDISVIPVDSKQRNLSSKKNKTYKEWLVNSPAMTIIDIVIGVIQNTEGKINAKNGILNIIVNSPNRVVKIDHKPHLCHNDVVIIENILADLMFDYYQPKVIESREIREANRIGAMESQQSIFTNINQHIRHSKEGGRKK